MFSGLAHRGFSAWKQNSKPALLTAKSLSFTNLVILVILLSVGSKCLLYSQL